MTRSLKLKTHAGGKDLPLVTIAPAETLTGVQQRSTTALILVHEITNIPDAVTDPQVVRAWRCTADLTWLGKPRQQGRYAFAWDEIGPGKIIR